MPTTFRASVTYSKTKPRRSRLLRVASSAIGMARVCQRRPGRAPSRSGCQSGDVLKLLAFVLPLGLDSFTIAAAIGAAQPVTARQRLRISLIFVAFEAGMPLIGLSIGSSLAHVIGAIADYLAAAAVIGIGAWMLTHHDDDDEQAAGRFMATRGTAVVALGISVSLDELAIGFSLGLIRLPLIPVLIAIGAQALLAAHLGLSLGARISEHLRERAGQVAGLALILLGGFLIAERVIR
jgi:putative Mn2+ efflux pump MntP